MSIIKRNAYFLLFWILPVCLYSQTIELQIKAKDSSQQKLLTNLSRKTKHSNYKELQNEVDSIYQKIIRLGYIDASCTRPEELNDSLFISTCNLGAPIKTVEINLPLDISSTLKKQLKVNSTSNTITTKVSNLEGLLETINKSYTIDGYPFAKVKLTDLKKSNDSSMKADLVVYRNKPRRIDRIITKGYEKFPKSYLKHYLKIKEGDVFNLSELNSKSSELSNLIFANQTRAPEVLFTKDSTLLYLYLQKDPSNNFDGFLGFGTNEDTNKLELDGYLNLHLINNLNYGESLKISYKSDEIDQQTIDVRAEAPYLFKSPIGADFRLNIFRKDSTFVTTLQHLRLNYQINSISKLSVGLQGITSNNLQEDTTSLIENYKSTFYSLSYDFELPQFYDKLFPVNFKLEATASQGSRRTEETTTQSRIELNTFKIFNLNAKNSIFLKLNGAALISDNYFDNELFRFGGINSIRGFEENSLVGNLFTVLNTEYRYRLSSNLFVNSIIDAGYYQNQLLDIEENLFGFGFGFGLLTQTGLFRLNYANAKVKNQPFNLSNSKVHISLIAKF